MDERLSVLARKCGARFAMDIVHHGKRSVERRGTAAGKLDVRKRMVLGWGRAVGSTYRLGVGAGGPPRTAVNVGLRQPPRLKPMSNGR